LPIILFCIIAAVFGLLTTLIAKKLKNRQKSGLKKSVLSSLRFQQKAMSAGFTSQEAAMLFDLALSPSSSITNPMAVLWSYKYLDIVIKQVIQNNVLSGKDSGGQEFLGKLLDHRKLLTVQKINARKSLTRSKEILPGQDVQVVLALVGIFTTKVISHDLYFAVLSPIVFDLPPNFKWENRKVMVFFRKKNDGEYSFNTTVVREIEDSKTGDFVLLLQHQETLSRTQKRQSIRMFLNKEAHIYPIGNGAGRSFAESMPCILNDVSDDGCSIVMEGKMNMPHTVIVQFMLNNQLIGINGECRSIQYNRTKNMSLLHIQADSIPRDVKNIILAAMFGLISVTGEQPVVVETSEEKGNVFLESPDQPDAALHTTETAGTPP
jgi:hypothetical protein